MNPKEKFDMIVNEIERLANGVEDQDGYVTYYGKKKISEKAFMAAQCYMDDRDRNALFQFLLGKTVQEYIDERKMMAAYKCVVEGKMGKGYSRAVEIAGRSSQDGFITKFENYFIISPKVAAVEKDISLLLPKANWDYVSGNDRFALEVARLTGHYRLNERECKLALELHRTYGIDIKEVYEYVYNYVWMFIEDEQDAKERDRDIEYYLQDRDVLRMYFEYRFSMDTIFGILLAKEIKMINKGLEECNKMYLEGSSRRVGDVINSQWFEVHYKRGNEITRYEEDYWYYMQRKTEEYTYYDYILYVELCRYYGRKEAFDSILPGHQDEKSFEEQIATAEKEYQEVLDKMYEEWDKESEKHFMEDEQRRFEEALEAYEAGDFEEEYVYYDEEEEYEFDYKEDFDEQEWSEEEFVRLCEEKEQYQEQRKLRRYSNFNVKEYLDIRNESTGILG